MPEKELDLLEVATCLPAKLGAGASEIMAAEFLDSDLARGLLDDFPNGPVAQASAALAALAELPQQRPVLDFGGGLSGVDGALDPERDGDGADAATLAAQIDDDPACRSK